VKLIWIMQSVDRGVLGRAAIVTQERSYSYQELNNAVTHMIHTLRDRGVRPGQRVVVLPDHNEVAVVFMAAASAIGLQLVMPYNLQEAALPEWRNIVDAVRPDHVLCLKRNADMLPQLADSCSSLIAIDRLDASAPGMRKLVVETPDPVRNFLVLFTSGTTGKPKAISISESLICARIASVSGVLGFDPKARVFLSGLMNNTTGIIFSLGSILHNATLHVPRDRMPDDWPRLIEQWGITHIMLRPIALKRFVDGAKRAGSKLGSLKVMAYGAAAMPRKLLEQAREMMPCDWVQGYGLSETFGPFCWLKEDDHKRAVYRDQVYCVGEPDDTLEVAVDADGGVGEVIVRGDALMEGYLDLATGEILPRSGWFRTGDYAEFSADNKLVLKGRIANTILSENGHRIYPEEVESVLGDIPGVDAALLLHLSDETNLGNSPVACIHGDLATRDDETIRRTIFYGLRASLSREKWPDYIYASKTPFPNSDNDKYVKAEVMKMVDREVLIVLSQHEMTA
jgi:acyl-CoA synthetase (AMP-forming)/AMP-acid ligase II